MEYGKRDPMKSVSAKEPTAFTMKTIQELLAEETAAASEAPTERFPLPQSHVQTPPHLSAGLRQPPADAAVATGRVDVTASPTQHDRQERTAAPTSAQHTPRHAASHVETTQVAEPKSRSFLSRLIGS